MSTKKDGLVSRELIVQIPKYSLDIGAMTQEHAVVQGEVARLNGILPTRHRLRGEIEAPSLVAH
jgi:hypothetical protein